MDNTGSSAAASPVKPGGSGSIRGPSQRPSAVSKRSTDETSSGAPSPGGLQLKISTSGVVASASVGDASAGGESQRQTPRRHSMAAQYVGPAGTPPPPRMSLSEAEAKVKRQTTFVSNDRRHVVCSSQTVRGFEYMMQHQDHNAIEALRTTLFPVLAHSLEAVLAAAVKATVDAELRRAEERAAAQAKRQTDAERAGGGSSAPQLQLVQQYVEAARRDYTDKSSQMLSPLLLTQPTSFTNADPVPQCSVDDADSPRPLLAARHSSLRGRPLLPVGSISTGLDSKEPKPSSAAATAASASASVAGAAASGLAVGALPEHPIIMLARELKKRAAGRDATFELPAESSVHNADLLDDFDRSSLPASNSRRDSNFSQSPSGSPSPSMRASRVVSARHQSPVVSRSSASIPPPLARPI
jgi:hypothetical protein